MKRRSESVVGMHSVTRLSLLLKRKKKINSLAIQRKAVLLQADYYLKG